VRISGVTSAFAVIHTKTLLQPCSACGFHPVVLFSVCSYHATGAERKRPQIHPHCCLGALDLSQVCRLSGTCRDHVLENEDPNPANAGFAPL